jgi:hypothetical protein
MQQNMQRNMQRNIKLKSVDFATAMSIFSGMILTIEGE